ncbi:MAG TPA: hypothetical protein EYP19_16915 [Desulfobacterales bacterium]|nr:hypothetical protein [Desulfobacterales bacterium]
MTDWVILRFPFDNPERPEVIEVLANVPIDWKQYLKKKAGEVDKEGRYVIANILYEYEYFYPEAMEEIYKKVEKESQ